MEINSELEVLITDTNENGFGITRKDGLVIFVPGLINGERAVIRITGIEKNYAFAECMKRLSDSEYRVEDTCPSAFECGGCSLGFVSFDYENIIKRNTVRAAFRRVGISFDHVSETVTDGAAGGYRNKIALHFDPDRQIFGYRRDKSHEVIGFLGCSLCSHEMNELVHWINANIRMIASLLPYSLQIRSASDTLTVSLYTENSVKDTFESFRDAVMNEFPNVSEVLLFSKKDTEKQRKYIYDRIFGSDMAFTSEAFRQVNTPVFEELLGIVHEFASEECFGTAADLYCGSGIIGLSLAKRFPDSEFWGIEINDDAVKDAVMNAENNGIDNIRFFSGDAATFRKRIPAQSRPELIVVDPPRAGLSKEMRSDLSTLAPERIIYVSCNPNTLARDCADLVSNGYDISKIVPVNMFPRTKHVETVVLLNQK